jgi:hypothetical protein
MTEVTPAIEPQDLSTDVATGHPEDLPQTQVIPGVTDVNPTHINAYLQDVEDAKKKVSSAQDELFNAISRLEAHPDYVSTAPPKAKKTVKAKKTTIPVETPEEPTPADSTPAPSNTVAPTTPTA